MSYNGNYELGKSFAKDPDTAAAATDFLHSAVHHPISQSCIHMPDGVIGCEIDYHEYESPLRARKFRLTLARRAAAGGKFGGRQSDSTRQHRQSAKEDQKRTDLHLEY